ncbi:Ku protein [Streptomyces sp. NPDC012751]|uniref:non-homologous end joining protein Ku n=1 Tax=Streptomyces sp. NPDC012751 TaxID=3364846 RepID=UPI0036BE780F
MRSIWNGAISFGLVNIPIKLVNATESHAISFRQIHTEDNGRIRYRKVCELDDHEVGPAEIGKAYEDADGTIIPITDEDLSHLPIPTARTIEIVAFVPADRIDPLQMGAAYYLATGGAPAAKPYILLREALKRSDKVAVAKYALRGRERLGMLRVVGEAIVMHGLLWPDEVRAPEGLAPDAEVTVRDKELDLADALMDTLGEVDLEDLHDEYREALEEVIAAKAAGEAPPEAPAPAEGGKVLDLMAALEKSVRAARESRGASGADAEVTQLRRARTTPKEAGGKKSTAKKTAPAKKTTPARKTTSKAAGEGTKRSATAKGATGKGATGKGAAAKKAAAAKEETGSRETGSRETEPAKAESGKGRAGKAGTKKAEPRKAASRRRSA